MKRELWAAIIILAISPWAWAEEAPAPLAPAKSESESIASNDPADWVLRYGPPDVDDSTANATPRPAIVTRWLDWKAERVRVMFVPAAEFGSLQRGCVKWVFIGTENLPDGKNISMEEADKRLLGRHGQNAAVFIDDKGKSHPLHEGIVLSVVDGDTLMVGIRGRKTRVRLRTVDAPEKGAPGFEEATSALEKKFPGGTRVIVTEYARDKYARMVGTVEPMPKKVKIVTPPKPKAERDKLVNQKNLKFNEKAIEPLRGQDLALWRYAGTVALKAKQARKSSEKFPRGFPTEACMIKSGEEYVFQFGTEAYFDTAERLYSIPIRVYLTDLGRTARVDKVMWGMGGSWNAVAAVK